MTELDELWQQAVNGDREAFGDWMGRVERPVRASLARWCRHVDAEAIVQEALLRMWVRAGDREAPPLAGEHASLRFAIGIARNLARNEARKRTRELPLDDAPEPEAVPDAPPDPLLARALAECLRVLTRRPREALLARIDDGTGLDDRTLAARLEMSLNVFLQNIVRARRQLAACLAGKGIATEEFSR